MIWCTASVVLLLAAIGQCIFLGLIGGRSMRPDNAVLLNNDPKGTVPRVSVLICARNEAANLRLNLPLILEQNYHLAGTPAYEVIVVDDASTDDTAAVLQALSAQHALLRTVRIDPDAERNLPGKKFPLSCGLAAAAFDHLLLTDADCRPAGQDWITHMAGGFLAGRSIVAGYGAYTREHSALNSFVRCETVHTFLQLRLMAGAGMPYMAVGRNLGVRKNLLIEAQQDPLWRVTPSGDDDLLVRLKATPENYGVCVHAAAFTYSPAKSSVGEYLHQKQRHMSTGKLYRPLVQALLGMNGLSHVLFWIALPLWLFGWISGKAFCVEPGIVLTVVLLRMCCFYFNLLPWSKRLGEKGLSFFYPLFDVLLAVYAIVLSPYILWKTKTRWR